MAIATRHYTLNYAMSRSFGVPKVSVWLPSTSSHSLVLTTFEQAAERTAMAPSLHHEGKK